MRRTRRLGVMAVITVLLGLVVIVGAFCYFRDGIRRLPVDDSKRVHATDANGGDQDSAPSVAVKVPFHEVIIVEPSGAEPIGGTVPNRVRVRTLGAALKTLVVKEREDTSAHSWEWVEFCSGAAPTPESIETEQDTGITTVTYEWDWNTTAVHNGNHILRVEADFTAVSSEESAKVTAEAAAKVLNLAIISCSPEGIVIWGGEGGTTVPITVNLQDNDLHDDPVNLTLKLYPTNVDIRTAWGPVRVMTANNIIRRRGRITALTYTFDWDGKDDSEDYVDTGTYTYEVEVSQPADNDLVTYRGGHWSGRVYNPYLSIVSPAGAEGTRAQEVEFDGEQDNGTPDDKSDDFYEYYIRLHVPKHGRAVGALEGEIWLYDPELNKVHAWNMADLPCRTHADEHDALDMTQTEVWHDLLLRVPKNLMPPEGTYRFVLNIKEDDVAKYRDHRKRLALNLSASTSKYKIECFIKHNYYIVWCRAESIDDIVKRVIDVAWKDPLGDAVYPSLRGAATRWVRGDPHEMLLVKRGSTNTVRVVFGTSKGQIRAAVNGGFFALPSYDPVGDVGTGFGWKYHYPSPRGKLWAFSMDATGGVFASDEVTNSPVYSWTFRERVSGYWHAKKAVSEAHAYGRGAVGLLVKDDEAQSRPPWWPPIIPGTEISVDLPLQRTAIAFSEDVGGGRRHFFLVSSVSSTWAQLAYFLSADGGLASVMKPMLEKKNGSFRALRIERAFMLDGGTSARLAYRAKDSGGQIVKCPWNRSRDYDFLLPGDDSRKLTDIIAVEATCKDVGNRPSGLN